MSNRRQRNRGLGVCLMLLAATAAGAVPDPLDPARDALRHHDPVRAADLLRRLWLPTGVDLVAATHGR